MRNANKRPHPVRWGTVAITLGLLGNKWSLEALSPDGEIESKTLTATIFILQALAIGLGIYLVRARPTFQIGEDTQRNLALGLASVFLGLLALEVTTRLWIGNLMPGNEATQYALHTEVPPESFQWTPHHYLSYYPTPNYKNGGTYHNSLGYRGREIEVAKPAGSFRIVTIGGSTTYTIGVSDNEKTFPYQLEEILRGEYGLTHVEVVNAGVGGHNSWESLINLQFRVLDIDPDLVIIYHGTNDVHTRLVRLETYRGDNSGRRKLWQAPPVPFWEHSALARFVLRRLGVASQVGLGSYVNAPSYLGAGSSAWGNNTQAYELLSSNQPIYFRRNLINMISVAKVHGIEVLLATWAYSPLFDDYASDPAYRHGFEENNGVVKDVATAHGVHLFDFATSMPQQKIYWRDGRHVNALGAALKARLFAQRIQELGLVTRTSSVGESPNTE